MRQTPAEQRLTAETRGTVIQMTTRGGYVTSMEQVRGVGGIYASPSSIHLQSGVITAITAGTGGTGSGVHQAHMGVVLPTAVIPPGPTNITTVDFRVPKVRIACDGVVTGNFTGLSSSFSLTSGTFVGNWTWSRGSTLRVEVLTVDDTATYLTVDIALEG